MPPLLEEQRQEKGKKRIEGPSVLAVFIFTYDLNRIGKVVFEKKSCFNSFFPSAVYMYRWERGRCPGSRLETHPSHLTILSSKNVMSMMVGWCHRLLGPFRRLCSLISTISISMVTVFTFLLFLSSFLIESWFLMIFFGVSEWFLKVIGSCLISSVLNSTWIYPPAFSLPSNWVKNSKKKEINWYRTNKQFDLDLKQKKLNQTHPIKYMCHIKEN